MPKKEIVQLYFSGIKPMDCFCLRQSNQTLLLSRNKRDQTNSYIEDKNGHRYKRDLELEQIETEYYVYCMI